MRIFIVVMIINLMWWLEKIAVRDYGLEAVDSTGLTVFAILGVFLAILQDLREVTRGGQQ